MKTERILGGLAAVTVGAAILITAMVSGSKLVKADDDDNAVAHQIKRGFEIAPVPLKYDPEHYNTVGYGSYLVNAAAGCNDCHSAGPQTQYLPGGNPYFGQTQKVNPAVYLGGGRDFGKLEGPNSPDIISRNLTPDKTGLPIGGRTFAEFVQIMRTGVDLDHLHPNCAASTASQPCFGTTQPFNGDLLQVMPWPFFQSFEEGDLRAIYEYLKAIPCIAGPETGVLHNDCT
jgi:hypothetical protein